MDAIKVVLKRLSEGLECSDALVTKAKEQLHLVEEKFTSTDNRYVKCADDILSLDLADAVINKQGCLVTILKRYFA